MYKRQEAGPDKAATKEDAGQFFDRYAETWNSYYTNAGSQAQAYDYLNRQRQVLAYAKQYIPKNAKVLEFGCGAGHTAVALAQRGYKLTCLDVSEQMIAATRENFARQFLKANFHVGELSADALDQHGPYDAIIGMGVMEYIEDHGATFSRINELLAPNGLCLLSFPNAYSPIRRLEDGLKRLIALPIGLLTGSRRFRDIAFRTSKLHAPGKASRAMEDSGLSVTRRKYLTFGARAGRFWFPPLFLVRRIEEWMSSSWLRWFGRNFLLLCRKPEN